VSEPDYSTSRKAELRAEIKRRGMDDEFGSMTLTSRTTKSEMVSELEMYPRPPHRAWTKPFHFESDLSLLDSGSFVRRPGDRVYACAACARPSAQAESWQAIARRVELEHPERWGPPPTRVVVRDPGSW
jgi:hypothetical protein